MISRRMQLVFLGSALTLAGPWACSSGASSTATGTGGTGGTATSSSTGLHTASTTTTTTTSAVSTGAGGNAGSMSLGLACKQDSDCGGAPLKCDLPTTNDPIFGGGPANGYCTMPCTTDAQCPTTGTCLPVTSGTSECVLSCTQGPQFTHINDPLVDTKCQGRDDLACEPIDSEGTLFGCLPVCGSDSQCPTGESCDQAASVCVPTAMASTGLPTGSICDPNANPSQCAGECLTIGLGGDAGATLDVCSQVCVFGGNIATTPNCGGDANGLCVYTATGEGAGDDGFCTSACTSQSDCAIPNLFCFPITNLTGTGTGETNNGWCLTPTPCPNGVSDCANNLGPSCVQTADGPFCLSTKYPLPVADGGTDGGGETDGGADAGDGG